MADISALTLEREIDESIMIDLRPFGLGLVKVTVSRLNREHVRLRLEADKRIRIDRDEVFWQREDARKADEKRRAATLDAAARQDGGK